MTTKVIVPCFVVAGKALRHRWCWKMHQTKKRTYRWDRICGRCGKWWDDVHAAWT